MSWRPSSSPATCRRKVVFPAPLRPMTHTCSPPRTYSRRFSARGGCPWEASPAYRAGKVKSSTVFPAGMAVFSPKPTKMASSLSGNSVMSSRSRSKRCSRDLTAFIFFFSSRPPWGSWREMVFSWCSTFCWIFWKRSCCLRSSSRSLRASCSWWVNFCSRSSTYWR